MSVVSLENVFKDYTLGEQQVHALIDITLSIDDGVFLAIAGPSGSGKSTILNLIGCIDTPSRGRVLIKGQDVSGKMPDQLADMRARTIGFIFQTFNLFPVLSAEENVEYPLLQLRELNASQRRERVKKYLDIVGLSRFAGHRPNQLSGGQRQRVAIARALATQANVILADEPTANLDHATGEGILQLMKEINREYKTTFIFSTHDRRVMAMADKLIRIEDGRLTTPGVGSDAAPVMAVRGKQTGISQAEALGVEPAMDAATAIREKIERFLYIDQRDLYMTVPWHIYTEAATWTVTPCRPDIGDPSAYIRKQLDAQQPFYRAVDALIQGARRRGINVDGWPAHLTE
jgi:putative ABC transport system ATP-binding protein